MSKKGISHRQFSVEFKLSVLSEYYRLGCSENKICRIHGLSQSTVARWEKEFVINEKELSLSDELLQKIKTMRRERERRLSAVSKTREQELEEEILRLRKALEYSELRNEALHEVLKIGREQYGVDLLKKAGAKQ